MNTTQDLGEITGTSTEWTTRFHFADGPHDGRPEPEDMARLSVEGVQAVIDGVSAGTDRFFGEPVTAVELVSRTVTDYAKGHKLIGPWEVTE